MTTDAAVTIAHVLDTQVRAAAALLNATPDVAGSISVHLIGHGAPIHIDLAALGEDPIPLKDLYVSLHHAAMVHLAALEQLLSAPPWVPAEPPP